MINKYAKAYVEVIEILKTLPIEEYIKIPKEKIDFYEQNKDKNYKFHIDTKKEISDQNISREANAILINLFRDYFATDRQKEILNNILIKNEQKTEEEKRKTYNPDNIFNKSKEQGSISADNKIVVINEERWYKKIINYFKSIFKK